jgi:SAM-dependent methyltransferase
MRYIAVAGTGIGAILIDELTTLLGPSDAVVIGNDGRNDVVAMTVRGVLPLDALRCAEDVFVEVASMRRPRGLRGLLDGLVAPAGIERALSSYAGHVRPLRPRMGYRVISRVLSERDFLRTALRDELSTRIGTLHPRWRRADPAQLEFWVLEVRPGTFVLCLRLTPAAFRQHGGRAEERPGALRPTMAAAMVRLAGDPAAAPIVDPCCGTGTILAEARSRGWADVRGIDVDAEAVRIARRNVSAATVVRGDARAMDWADQTAGAVVSNLPFGNRYTVPGNASGWLRDVVNESVRVVRPGGPVVLLTSAARGVPPVFERHPHIRIERRIAARTLGMDVVLWALRSVS